MLFLSKKGCEGSLVGLRVVGLGAAGVLLVGAGLSFTQVVSAADSVSAPPLTIVQAVVANENEAEKHRDHFTYLSFERSDRTGGHLWEERVAETTAGKVKMLISEDGQPLNADRQSAEMGRLQDIAAHPDAFATRSQAVKNDEAHAKNMLLLLQKAYVFENARQEGGFLKIDFRPNPTFAPQSMEERVLHGMSGSVTVEQPVMRLHAIQARLPEDVSLGFGLLATIHAGSNFSTIRERVYGNEWKTSVLNTDINGRAIFFKTIAKKEHAEHRDFKVLPTDMTVAQAVDLLEKQ